MLKLIIIFLPASSHMIKMNTRVTKHYDYQINYGSMCKVLKVVMDRFYIGIRNADLSDNQV